MTPLIRALVVDASPTQLAQLVGLLQRTGTFTVVGTARDGHLAVRAVEQLRPQVVLMDIHLPGMDGYTATREIMDRCPTPIVLASAATLEVQAALAAGALTVVRKPGGDSSPAAREDQIRFLTTLQLMAGVRVVTRHARYAHYAHYAPPAPAAPAAVPPRHMIWDAGEGCESSI